MFIAQLARKQEVNPAFFYDFVVDKEGNLMYVFWADAMSRKNYHFGGDGVVSFDSTYTTNQYDMMFAPFTGVNHHLQSVFLVRHSCRMRRPSHMFGCLRPFF